MQMYYGWDKIKAVVVMENIKAKWHLPEKYLKFLEENADNRYFETEEYDEIEIYGANDFICGQYGYSYNPQLKQDIEEWNPNYVVVGNSSCDPFCIDISMKQSPVYFAYHGAGCWDFAEVFSSFEEMLQMLEKNEV